MRVNLLLRGFGLQHNDGMFRLDALNLTLMGHQHPGLSDLLKTSTFAMVLGWKRGDCQLRVRDKLLPQVEELKYLGIFFPKI